MKEDSNRIPHGVSALRDDSRLRDIYNAGHESWSQQLKCVYDICSRSLVPMSIYLPMDGRLFYNEAWRSMIEPQSAVVCPSGSAAQDIYGEQWKTIEPSIAQVMRAGESMQFGRQLFGKLHNSKYDGCFNYMLQPIDAEDGNSGVLMVAERSCEDIEIQNDDFVATIVHELRNPFSALASAAQLFSKAADRPQMMLAARDALSRQVTHLAQLLDDLLDISRLRRGNIRLYRQPIPLSETVSAAIQAATPAMESKQHKIAVTNLDSTILIDGDKQLVVRIFSNLLKYIAKHTEASGVMQLSALRHESAVDVTISNVRLSPEMAQRALGKFQEKKAQHVGRGLDLSLHLVCKLVQLHEGSIAASGNPDASTDFTIRLPLASADSAEQPSSTS